MGSLPKEWRGQDTFYLLKRIFLFPFFLYSVNWLVPIITSIIPFHHSVLVFIFPWVYTRAAENSGRERKGSLLCLIVWNGYKFLGSKHNQPPSSSVFCSFLSCIFLDVPSCWWLGLLISTDNANQPIKFLTYEGLPALHLLPSLLLPVFAAKISILPGGAVPFIPSHSTYFLPHVRQHSVFIHCLCAGNQGI